MFSDAWAQISSDENSLAEFDVKILAESKALFTCVGGIPVTPHASYSEIMHADVVIITDLSLDLDPDTDHSKKMGRHCALAA